MSWLISKALMNSLYSLEQEVESSEESSLDGEQSVLLNGNPTQQAYCAPDKMTDFSRLSRFGMTYKPLTENLGEELLTLYLEDFHAKTSQQPEKAQGLTESGQECGITWRGWLAKFDPDTFSWKTAQCSLLEDLNESLETLPRSGMTRSGLLWELPMLEQTTKETGFGLSEQIWPTPAARDGKPTNTLEALTDGRFVDQLANRVKMVENNIWTTPCSRDWKGHTITPNHPNGFNKSLANDVLKFPTPQASDCRDRGNMSNPSIQRRAEKGKQLNLSMVAHPTSGKLNPDWVEWLMNWPIKWSDLNGFDPKEFERWQKASAAPLQESVQMRTVWWDRDPSQASHRPQHKQQQEQQHCNSLHQVSRGASCESTMERSHEGQDLPVLRDSVHLQTSKRENLQSGVWEQTCLDETQIVPRVGGTGIAFVDRLKAIGNGQVPLCAATAWRLLTA